MAQKDSADRALEESNFKDSRLDVSRAVALGQGGSVR